METTESDPDEVKRLLDIGLRMQQGKKVSFQDQLKYYRHREEVLSPKLKDGGIKVHRKLEITRMKIEEISQLIMNSGRSGGGTTGEASKRDTHKPEH